MAKTTSIGEVMVTAFWDTRGILFSEQHEKGKNSEYYANLLWHWNNKTKKKMATFSDKKVLFHQDNTPAHTLIVVMAEVKELKSEWLPCSSWTPDEWILSLS